MRRLPPLKALRAFEATARLGGVQRASEELHVTHGAVSRHVKQLEDWLGVELFDRSQRTLKLNELGEEYLKSISSALDLIQQGTLNLLNHKPSNTLGIATTHSIANKWLMSRLSDFSIQHPEIEVWLSMDQARVDFVNNRVDLAIRMGKGPWPDNDCIALMTDRLITVCSPKLLESGLKLNSPSDLSNFTLLHDQDPDTKWSIWFKQNHIEHLDDSKGPRFSSTDILLEAAMSGRGVALVNEVLAANDLAHKRLMQPLSESVSLGNYYWLVLPKNKLMNSNVKLFCEWVKNHI